MVKSLKQFIAEAERKFSPENESLIHHLLLGHSGKNFQEMYSKGKHLEKPENPTKRNANQIITTFYNHSSVRDKEDVPELTGTYIKKSISRLRNQGHEPAISTRKEGEISHADRIEEVGGIEKVFDKRKKGLHDSEIFKGTTPNQQNKLRKYIDNVHGKRPDYHPFNAERPQKHSQETINTVAKHRESGLSASQIASEMNMTKNQIINLMRQIK